MADSEIGGDHCECNVPLLETEHGHIGNWFVQIVYCGQCGERLRTVVTHQAVIDGADEPDDEVLPDFEELVA